MCSQISIRCGQSCYLICNQVALLQLARGFVLCSPCGLEHFVGRLQLVGGQYNRRGKDYVAKVLIHDSLNILTLNMKNHLEYAPNPLHHQFLLCSKEQILHGGCMYPYWCSIAYLFLPDASVSRINAYSGILNTLRTLQGILLEYFSSCPVKYTRDTRKGSVVTFSNTIIWRI